MEQDKIKIAVKLNGEVSNYSLAEYRKIYLEKKFPPISDELLAQLMEKYSGQITEENPFTVLVNCDVVLKNNKVSPTKITNLEKFLTSAGVAAHMAYMDGVNSSFVNGVGLVGFVVGSNLLHKVFNPEKSLKKAMLCTLGGSALFVAASRYIPNDQIAMGIDIVSSYIVGAGLIGAAYNLVSKEDKKNKIK